MNCKKCGRFYGEPENWGLCPACQKEEDEECMILYGQVPIITADGTEYIMHDDGTEELQR